MAIWAAEVRKRGWEGVVPSSMTRLLVETSFVPWKPCSWNYGPNLPPSADAVEFQIKTPRFFRGDGHSSGPHSVASHYPACRGFQRFLRLDGNSSPTNFANAWSTLFVQNDSTTKFIGEINLRHFHRVSYSDVLWWDGLVSGTQKGVPRIFIANLLRPGALLVSFSFL